MAVRPIPQASRPVRIARSDGVVDHDAAQRALDSLHTRLIGVESAARDVGTSGRWLNRQVLTGVGDYVPTPGTKAIHARIIAGGGGGGGANSTVIGASGAGGNSGWVLDFRISTQNDTDIVGGPFSCGAGGSGGPADASANGSTGGDTVLNVQGKSYISRGGTGGGSGNNFNAAPSPPTLTSTSNPTILSYCAIGSAGIPFAANQLAYSGAGGGVAPFGTGGFAVNAGPAQGGPGLGFGAGGGGGCADFFTTAGAAGSAGAILIDEYS